MTNENSRARLSAYVKDAERARAYRVVAAYVAAGLAADEAARRYAAALERDGKSPVLKGALDRLAAEVGKGKLGAALADAFSGGLRADEAVLVAGIDDVSPAQQVMLLDRVAEILERSAPVARGDGA